MASTTDSRAAGFSASEFRDAIQFAMNMGLPENIEDRATFRWKTVKTFDVEDAAGKPYFYDATPSKVVAKEDVQVPVAVKFIPSTTKSAGTAFGEIDATKAEITVLDVDYENIIGADLVLLGGDIYVINYIAPPVGLFGATVYTIYCTAEDEN